MFRLLHDTASGCMSYLLADKDAGEAVLIDPRGADVSALRALMVENRLRLRWVLRTHEHDAMLLRESSALATLGAPVIERQVPRGVILGAAAGIVYTRKSKLPVAAMCDAVAPCLMLGYAIGRLGCQISGDGDWGMAANLALKPDALPLWLWAQTYDGNIAGVVIAPPGVYPTPIYESAMAVVCFLILQALRRHAFRPGWLFACYLVLAGLERLLIEQIRVNPTFEIAGFVATQSEFISALFVLLGLTGILVLGRRPT